MTASSSGGGTWGYDRKVYGFGSLDWRDDRVAARRCIAAISVFSLLPRRNVPFGMNTIGGRMISIPAIMRCWKPDFSSASEKKEFIALLLSFDVVKYSAKSVFPEKCALMWRENLGWNPCSFASRFVSDRMLSSHLPNATTTTLSACSGGHPTRRWLCCHCTARTWWPDCRTPYRLLCRDNLYKRG